MIDNEAIFDTDIGKRPFRPPTLIEVRDAIVDHVEDKTGALHGFGTCIKFEFNIHTDRPGHSTITYKGHASTSGRLLFGDKFDLDWPAQAEKSEEHG